MLNEQGPSSLGPGRSVGGCHNRTHAFEVERPAPQGASSGAAVPGALGEPFGKLKALSFVERATRSTIWGTQSPSECASHSMIPPQDRPRSTPTKKRRRWTRKI